MTVKRQSKDRGKYRNVLPYTSMWGIFTNQPVVELHQRNSFMHCARCNSTQRPSTETTHMGSLDLPFVCQFSFQRTIILHRKSLLSDLLAILVTWLSSSKSHMRSHNIRVTFSENGRQYGFVCRDLAVPLEQFNQTFMFRIATVFKHVHNSRTLLFKAILSRTSCAVTQMSNDNANVSMATQEFTPFRWHISLCKQNRRRHM